MSREEYFQYLDSSFGSDSISMKCVIGGHCFELLFPNEKAMQAFDVSFKKADQAAAAEFQVCIWDAVQSEKPPITPAWKQEDYLQKGEIAGFQSERYRLVYEIGAQVLSMADLYQRRAHYWTPDLNSVPFWERGSPLRNIIHWFLPVKRKHLIHAAGVGTERGGVLIVGKGGSGKSTTALSCLNTNLLYSGDDYCALSNDGKGIVHQVFSTAKVVRGSFKEKEVVYVGREHPQKILSTFPLKGVIYPTIKHREAPELVPAKKSTLLQELAASTIFQLPGKNQEVLSFLSKVIQNTPCYTLHLSKHFQKNGELLEQWLEK